jgi:transcriptional regulator with XRE-family HTH domain
MHTIGKEARRTGKQASTASATMAIPSARKLADATLQRWMLQRREALGLTRAEVARRARVTELEVDAFERGDCGVLENARKMTRLYGVPFVLYAIWTGFLRPADLTEWGRWDNDHDSAGSRRQ